MISSDIEHSTGDGFLIDADKKNIRNESAAVIILGLLLLVFFSIFLEINYLWSYFLISFLYVLTGISGCICLKNSNPAFQMLYKVLIIVLMIVKATLIGFLIFVIVELILNPVDCSKSESESCGLVGALWIVGLVVSIVGLIVFSATLVMLFVMLKHLKKYQDDIRSLGFIRLA